MEEAAKVHRLKLARADSVTIILGVFGAWFLGSWFAQGNWAGALGSAVWGILLGFAIVGTINKRWCKKNNVVQPPVP